MEKLSKEISKKIISLESGNNIGYILDVLFDDNLKIIKGYLLADEESEELLFLPTQKVKSKGEECYIVQSENDTEVYFSSFFNNPIGKIVYDEKGFNLGVVKDVYFDKKQVKRIVTNKCEFSISYLKKAGDDCLIFGRKKQEKAKKVDFEVKGSLPKVYIQKEESLSSKDVGGPIKVRVEDYSIIGKRVTHRILGLNNELVANPGDRITKNIIQKAKLHNRYNLLMFYLE